MAQIDEIVSVNITAQTQVITTAEFSIPLIVAEFNNFTDIRARVYGSQDALLADFAASSVVGTIGSKIFGQDNSPSTVVVGRKLANEDYPTALAAISAENDSWFAVVAASHVYADVSGIANYIAATKKIYFTSTQDPATITTDQNSTGAKLKALGYDQTSLIYHSQADTYFPEAAWVGSQLSYTPGANDWENKTLEGVPADRLNDTARTNLTANNVAYYTTVGGVNITRNADMVDNTPIDQKIGELWTIARMQESVFGMLIRQPKVPYTDEGFTKVEAQMRSVLALGVQNLLYSSYTIQVPRVADIPVNQRAARVAGDFKFTAVLAGSIRKIVIVGTVTI